MTNLRCRCAFVACLLLHASSSFGSQRPAGAVRQEREQAAREVPQLAELLALKPGMIVADVGAGGGAMSVVMAKWLGPEGRVYATDIRAEQLAEIRAAVAQDALSNVVVLEGAESSTNLPSECCDAIFLRDVYHHLTRPHEFDASLLAALKPGGRLAVIDFPPEPGLEHPGGRAGRSRRSWHSRVDHRDGGHARRLSPSQDDVALAARRRAEQAVLGDVREALRPAASFPEAGIVTRGRGVRV